MMLVESSGERLTHQRSEGRIPRPHEQSDDPRDHGNRVPATASFFAGDSCSRKPRT